MNLLADLTSALASLQIPFETGIFKDVPPDEYLVITPLADTFEVFADNLPNQEIQEARLSLFCKGNYLVRKEQITKALLYTDITITDRRYIGHEDDTDYHHLAIDVAKYYEFKEE